MSLESATRSTHDAFDDEVDDGESELNVFAEEEKASSSAFNLSGLVGVTAHGSEGVH